MNFAEVSDAAALKTLHDNVRTINTSATVDLTNITGITGDMDDLTNLLTLQCNATFRVLTTAAKTLHDSITVDEANTLNATTTGVVTATISTSSVGGLSGLAGAEAGQGTPNAYTIVITNTSADAGDLNTIDGLTSIAVNIAAVDTVTGSYSEINTFETNIANFSNVANDTILQLDDGSGNNTTINLATQDLETLIDNFRVHATAGKLNLSKVTQITGAVNKFTKAGGIDALNTSGVITGLSTQAIT